MSRQLTLASILTLVVTAILTPVSTTGVLAASGTWGAATSMAAARADAVMVALRNGDVLVAGGGGCGNALATAEVYHTSGSQAGTWTPTANSMSVGRYFAAAALLPDGKVLVAGGSTSACSPTTSADLYDPTTNSWQATASMHYGRAEFTATTLPAYNEALIVGGFGNQGVSQTAELYSESGGWTLTGWLNVGRQEHAAALLPNGDVLVMGGNTSAGITASAEVFDPATNAWTPTGSMNVSRDDFAATALNSGQVLAVGGNSNSGYIQATAEVYDPTSGQWTLTASMSNVRRFPTATLLGNGEVLVAGGDAVYSLSSAELYVPGSGGTGTWVSAGSMSTPRTEAVAALLPNGSVLVAGGDSASTPQSSADVYTPASGGQTSGGTFVTGASPHSVTTADFNGDGYSDIAVANAGAGTVQVLYGNGDGTFASPATVASGLSSPQSLAVADFNGDAHPDLAIANSGGNSVEVLLGGAGGPGGTPVMLSVGSDPVSIATGDFNGDGHPDIAVANAGDGTVQVLYGKGDGTFATPVVVAFGLSGPQSVAVGDFNGDGHPDLVVANSSGNTVSVLLNWGDGTFGTPVSYTVGSHPLSVTTGSFTSGGHLDIAVANSGDGTVQVLYGNGDGTFATPATVASSLAGPQAVATGDLNGDGHTDLAIANSGSNHVEILLGSATGLGGTPTNVATGSDPVSVATGDFNRDGAADLAVANAGDGTVSVILSAHAILNPRPTLASINPQWGQACTSDCVASVSLTVTGSNFLSSSLVQWNGTSLPTTYVSGSQLTTQIPHSDLTTFTTASITVYNPPSTSGGSDGGTSQAQSFYVTQTGVSVVSSSTSSTSASVGSAPNTVSAAPSGGGLTASVGIYSGNPVSASPPNVVPGGYIDYVGLQACSPCFVTGGKAILAAPQGRGAPLSAHHRSQLRVRHHTRPPVHNHPHKGAPLLPKDTSGSTSLSVTLTDCDLHGGTMLYWYGSSTAKWAAMASQSYTNATGTSPACITTTVTGTSSPSLSDLSGGVVIAAGLASLTITPSSPTMTYGDTSLPTITPSYSGFVGGDTATSLTTQPTCGVVDSNNNPITISATTPAGTYTTTCSGAASSRYTFTYQTGTLTVKPVPLNITASNATMTYGDITLPTITPSYSGLKNGATAPATPATCGTVATTQSGAGSYRTFCQNAADSNYSISYVDGTLTIKPASATVSIPAADANPVKIATAGGTASVPLTATLSTTQGTLTTAAVTFTLTPLSPGGRTYSCTVSRTTGQLTATAGSGSTCSSPTMTGTGSPLTLGATLSGLVPGVYSLTTSLGGNYTASSGSQSGVVTVYDPSLGYTVGGGTFTRTETSGSVPIAFGFVAKVINGQVQGAWLAIEHRSSVDVVLQSTSLTSLTIVPGTGTVETAYLQGKTTYQGTSGYTFLAKGIDADSTGPSSNPDQYGQQVKTPSGTLVSDLSYNALPLTSGDIHVP